MLPSNLYHIFNRGVNKTKIYFSDANYDYFCRKLLKYISSRAQLLGFCLMPNHFHLLVRSTEESLRIEEKDYPRVYPFHRMTQLSKGLKTMLSSYALAINKQEGRDGSLFKQNTKIKHVGDGDIESYAFWCLHYIHMNPVKAGLVQHPGDWKWSSYNEYFGDAEMPICDTDMGRKVLYLDVNDLVINVPRL